MADPADFAYHPPTNDNFVPGYLPPVEKQMPVTSRPIQQGEGMETPVASGITRRTTP